MFEICRFTGSFISTEINTMDLSTPRTAVNITSMDNCVSELTTFQQFLNKNCLSAVGSVHAPDARHPTAGRRDVSADIDRMHLKSSQNSKNSMTFSRDTSCGTVALLLHGPLHETG